MGKLQALIWWLQKMRDKHRDRKAENKRMEDITMQV